ncbi:MAG TPA: Vms1/Ankzf1 family peptidyl-tRNA hydrolase [Dehalococcoidales bacterium]|nr:Vms1/Ankzf1 family peptidyl-tRNA hydrolase [Dehalococcoidales bacterium]
MPEQAIYRTERYKLTKPRMLNFLKHLNENSQQIASLYVPPGYAPKTIEGLLETSIEKSRIPPEAVKAINESATGAVIFWGDDQRYLIMPPFPILEESSLPGCNIEPLTHLLNRKFCLALILVRLGAFAIGVYLGEERICSKVGTGNVHARHRQGGSSSHRFERHREKQMETFFTRVCQHAREQLEPFERQVEWMIYGGTRETLLEFRKQCHYLAQFDSRTLDLLLNIREPKQAGLEEAIREAWSCRIIRWVEN